MNKFDHPQHQKSEDTTLSLALSCSKPATRDWIRRQGAGHLYALKIEFCSAAPTRDHVQAQAQSNLYFSRARFLDAIKTVASDGFKLPNLARPGYFSTPQPR